MSKKTPWVYGKSPNPSNWHEAVEILKQTKKDKPPTVKQDKHKDR